MIIDNERNMKRIYYKYEYANQMLEIFHSQTFISKVHVNQQLANRNATVYNKLQQDLIDHN